MLQGGSDSLPYARFQAVVQAAAHLTGQETRTVARGFRAGGESFTVNHQAFVDAISAPPAEK